MPKNGLDEPINYIERVGTDAYWAARKDYVYKEVFTSMDELIEVDKTL